MHSQTLRYTIQRKKGEGKSAKWIDALTGSDNIDGTLNIAFAIHRMGHKVRVVDSLGRKIWPWSLHHVTEKMDPITSDLPVMITDEFWKHLIERQGMDVPEWLPMVTVGTIATIGRITPNTFKEPYPVEILWKVPEDPGLYASWVWYGVADRMRRCAYALELGFSLAEDGNWQR